MKKKPTIFEIHDTITRNPRLSRRGAFIFCRRRELNTRIFHHRNRTCLTVDDFDNAFPVLEKAGLAAKIQGRPEILIFRSLSPGEREAILKSLTDAAKKLQPKIAKAPLKDPETQTVMTGLRTVLDEFAFLRTLSPKPFDASAIEANKTGKTAEGLLASHTSETVAPVPDVQPPAAKEVVE